jgi:hypothetical protein
MYAGGLLYLLATPLALGSYRGLIAFAPMVPLLALHDLWTKNGCSSEICQATTPTGSGFVIAFSRSSGRPLTVS